MAGSEGPEAGASGASPGCLAAVGAVVLGALIVVASAVVLMRRGGDAVEIGTVADYAPGSVTYRSTDGVLVVRKADGGIVAFSDVDPHNPAGRSVCRVTYRADLPAGAAGADAGGQGRFFDVCTGSMYDLDGHGLAGDGLDLRPVRVKEEDKGRLLAYPR